MISISEMQSLGDRIKEYRSKKTLSQRALASMLDVDRQTIANIESGRTKKLQMYVLQRLRERTDFPVGEVEEAEAEASSGVSESEPGYISPSDIRVTLKDPETGVHITIGEPLSRQIIEMAKQAGKSPAEWVLESLRKTFAMKSHGSISQENALVSGPPPTKATESKGPENTQTGHRERTDRPLLNVEKLQNETRKHGKSHRKSAE